MYIRQITNEEFNKFRNSFKYKSLYQSPEYGFVMNHHGYDCLTLGLVDDENHILASSLILIQNLKSYKYAYAPRGFLIDYSDFNLLETFTNQIKQYLSNLNVIAIRINPLINVNIYDKKFGVITHNEYYDKIYDNLKKLGYRHFGYNKNFEAFKPRYEAIVDLDKPYYLLFKDINKEYRTKIRTSSAIGIQIFKSENLEHLYLQTKQKYPRDLSFFNDCYKYFSKNNNIDFYFAKLNTEEYLKVINTRLNEIEKKVNYYNENILEQNNINLKLKADKDYAICKSKLIEATKLLKANPKGIITASALIIKNQDEVYLFMDGYDPKYKKFNSKHLLIWKLIESYSNQEYKKFNFGGISDPFTESKYSGLTNFKLGFHAKSYEYIGDLELICNNAKYFLARKSKINNTIKK